MLFRLHSIAVVNYRSCVRSIFTPNDNLSTLIGPNGSGKSNILNGILLLKKSLLTQPHHSTGEFANECKITASFRIDGKNLKVRSKVTYGVGEKNNDDILNAKMEWNFKEFNGDDYWIHIPLGLFSDFDRYPSLFQHEIPIRRLVGKENSKNTNYIVNMFAHEKTQEQSLLRRMREYISAVSYYSASQFTDPSRCPNSFTSDGERPYLRMTDHLRFLKDLHSAYSSSESSYHAYISIVGSSGIGLIEDLHFEEINLPSQEFQVMTGGRVIKKEIKKTIIIPSFKVNGTKLSPNQLSEGTFKTLALVFYLMTDKCNILLLEEPEVCIHHGLLKTIIELVIQVSKKKQIIMSTHSDVVLDYLGPSDIFVVKNIRGKGTTVRKIEDRSTSREMVALARYLETTGSLGDYWRYGGLER